MRRTWGQNRNFWKDARQPAFIQRIPPTLFFQYAQPLPRFAGTLGEIYHKHYLAYRLSVYLKARSGLNLAFLKTAQKIANAFMEEKSRKQVNHISRKEFIINDSLFFLL